MPILDVAALFLFPMMMAYAAWSDLFTMTISNTISIVLVVAFILMAALEGMPWLTLLEGHIAAGAAVLTLTFILFARGWIGGGDAKLAAATAVWLGWGNLMAYGLQASLMGAVLTLGILALRKVALPERFMGRAWIARLHQNGGGVPYGIALAAAGLAIYPDTPLWQAIVGH